MQRRTFLGMAMAALQTNKWESAANLIQASTSTGEVSAAALFVSQGKTTFERGFGNARGPGEIFLLASITKPMTAAGLMRLVERKQLALTDPVHKFIPEFTGGDRAQVTVQHLLTHTSGLPDMLSENTALRKRHAGLKVFVEGACRTPLLFKPGTEVRYQSMGILLAAEIAERITKTPFRDFLRKEIFQPLQMKNTALGMGDRKIADTAQCQVPTDDDWNWNSPYWRNLGAPWGGAHSSAREVAMFLQFYLHPRNGNLSPMIQNQTKGLNKAWGIGFMLEPGTFGKNCSPRAFGHYGSTGTVAWADPAKDLTCVLLTTKPADQSRAGLLGPVSDFVSQSS